MLLRKHLRQLRDQLKSGGSIKPQSDNQVDSGVEDDFPGTKQPKPKSTVT